MFNCINTVYNNIRLGRSDVIDQEGSQQKVIIIRLVAILQGTKMAVVELTARHL